MSREILSLSEAVPFDLATSVRAGLEKKYGSEELSSYTFGVELEYRPSDRIINYSKLERLLGKSDAVDREYETWLEDRKKNINRRWRGDLDNWDEEYGPPTEDEWLDHNPEPVLDDYTAEDFDKLHTSWSDKRSEIVYINKKYSSDSHRDEFIQHLIKSEEWPDYVDSLEVTESNSDESILDASRFIVDELKQKVTGGEAGPNNWSVGEDGDNVEIRTKHLSQNEFDLITKICEYVSNEETGGDTSAHVHVGLPKDFDAFDLLAISTLVDEKSVESQAGPERELNSFARLRYHLHEVIIRLIIRNSPNEGDNKSFEIKNESLSFILSKINRNHRTNIKSMTTHGTIEFRYLSSDIAVESKKLINWIKYFILLPKIAKSRNKVEIKSNVSTPINPTTAISNLVAIRLPGRVRFILSGSSSLPNEPSSAIKKGELPISPKIAQMKKQKQLPAT